MRALFCLEPRTSYERIEAVTRAAGMDAVVVGEGVAEDPALCAQLEASRLDVVLNLPLFFDRELLARLPDAYAVTSAGRRAEAGWLHMACPRSDAFWHERVDRMRRAVAATRPAMVSLDFARMFVWWEQIAPDLAPDQIEHGCFCPACLDSSGPRSAPDRERMGRRATQAVTDRVRDAARVVREASPTTLVGVKVVPWLDTDYDGARGWACGQDLRALAPFVDVVMPMSYSSMIRRPAGYLAGLHAEIRETTGRQLVPWVQAANADEGDLLALDALVDMLTAIEPDADVGYCVFHLDGIADRPDVLELLSSRASRVPSARRSRD